MHEIPTEVLDALRSAGLHVNGKAFGAIAYQHARQIEIGITAIDDPVLTFSRDGEEWIVAHETRIGRGKYRRPDPAEWENRWSTAQEAVADILDFYLVHPERMRETNRLIEERDRRAH